MNTLGGFKIIEDIYMVEYYSEKVKRTFMERLFSFSWFVKYKNIIKTKPKTDVIKYEDKLIMHPEIVKKLLDETENKNKTTWEKGAEKIVKHLVEEEKRLGDDF